MDSLKLLSTYGYKIIFWRSKKRILFDQAIENIDDMSFINCGIGKDSHPTQTLGDLYYLYCELFKSDFSLMLQEIRKLKILFFGDIKNSRVASSWKELADKLECKNFYFIDDFSSKLASKNCWNSSTFIKNFLQMDILYLFRGQQERWSKEEKLRNIYSTFKKDYLKQNKKIIILHPGPINWGKEIENDRNFFFQSSRFKYVEQAEYCAQFRKGLISYILNYYYKN